MEKAVDFRHNDAGIRIQKMNWTHEQLKQLGYSQNPDGSFSRTECVAPRIPHPVPQPDSRPALDDALQGEAPDLPRFGLRITRISCQPLDADNFAGGCKFLIDAIRRRGLIPDDDPQSVEISFRQIKAKTKAEEGTSITITFRRATTGGV
jgi:hypothetical protein